MTANDRQEGGNHYKKMSIQPWDAMESWMTQEQFAGYLMGSALAYLARVNTEGVEGKGGITDVRKAKHYLDKWLEVTEKAQTLRNVTIASVPVGHATFTPPFSPMGVL